MRLPYLYVSLAIAAQASAQSLDLDSIISDVYSIYTEVTSIWESDASAATASTAASSTDALSTSSTTSSSTDVLSTSSSTTSSTTTSTSSFSTSPASSASAAKAQKSASQTASSAAASSTSSGSANHGRNHETLAIVLGCVLGALALGLLIFVLLLCCKRRRRRDSSSRHVLPPRDEEVESWRHRRSTDMHRPGSSRNLVGHDDTAVASVIAPNMAEHPAYGNPNQENPFVPIPPPARRTAPNSRAGLTDAMLPGDEPYLTDQKTGNPLNPNNMPEDISRGHHKGEAVVAGLGGAALAGAAMHQHHKKDDDVLAKKHDHQHDLLRGDSMRNNRAVPRKPVASGPVSPISPIENSARPFPTTTTNDDAYALNKIPSRRSGESTRRSSLSRDRAVLATGPWIGSDVHSVPYDSTRQNSLQPNTSTPLSPFNSAGRPRPTGIDSDKISHDPLLAGAVGIGAGALAGTAVAHHNNRKHSKSRSPSQRRHSLISGDKKRDSHSDTSTSNSSSIETRDMAAEMPEDVPPTPPMRSRRNSALGTAAPSAALGSYQDPSLNQHQRQPQGENIPPVPTILPTSNTLGNGHTAYGWGNGYVQGQRQQRRDQTPPAVPSRSPRRTRFSDVPLEAQLGGIGSGNGGIVGDNRYPHLGAATRGGDDFESVVPLKTGAAEGLGPRMERDSSDDSTWRLSSGMPGGWQKEHHRDSGARNSGVFARDSGVSGMGTRSRSGSMTSSSGVGNGRRLRLADLKREEEEKERERGRQTMTAEWSGNGGYDGYDYYHGAGVGQAL